MRIIGFILLIGLATSNMLVKRRLPPVKTAGGFFNIRAFRSAPFSFYCASTFVLFFGISTSLRYPMA